MENILKKQLTNILLYDTIKKSNNILLEYEDKLKLLAKEDYKNELLERANKLSKEELIEEIKKL